MQPLTNGIVNRISFQFLCFLMLLSGPVLAQSKQSDKNIETIDASVRTVILAIGSTAECSKDNRKSIGLWQLDGSKVPLPDAALKRIYGEIVARLSKHSTSCLSIVDSSSVGEIIQHLVKSGAVDRTGGNEVAAIQEVHQDVDYLIFPELYSQADSYRLTLRAIERKTARTIKQQSPVVVPQEWWKTAATDKAISLDFAIDQAVKLFTSSTVSFKILETRGIFFEDTDSQPSGSRFIRDKVEAALTQRLSSSITGGGVRVRGISIDEVDANQVEPEKLNEEAVAKKASAALLSGRYWLRNDVVDLRLALRLPDARDVIWQGSIKRSDLAHLTLEPARPQEPSRKIPKASFSFQLTTPKGTAPTYKVGDELSLRLLATRDVRAYCFYIDSKGQVLPILPTPGRSAGSDSNVLKPKVIRKLPDPKHGETFRFRITSDTVGEETVSCFATTADVSAKLPKELFPDRLKPIPLLRLSTLREIFGNLAGVEVAEASVTATITGD